MFPITNPEISGLAKHADIIILRPNHHRIIYNKPLDKAFTYFISAKIPENIAFFVSSILPRLTHPVNIIIAGTDATFPVNLDARGPGYKLIKGSDCEIICDNANINCMYVENLAHDIPKAKPLPLGIVSQNHSYRFMDHFIKHQHINAEKPLKFTNFNRLRTDSTQWAERWYVKALCDHEPWSNHQATHPSTTKSHAQYLSCMSKYMFTICVHGGGIDVNPKLWESLLVGTIPIIKENKPYTDLYRDLELPVVIVKDWKKTTINESNLTRWRDKYYPHFTDPEKRQDMLHKLTLDYWIKTISTSI